jgi:hypothetical protein
VCRYKPNLNRKHWAAIVQLMKYLKGIMDYGILYNGFPTVLERHNNANWISDSDEMTGDYIFILGGGVVSWKSSKQSLITRFTMKS